jgi:LPS-assembly lipoprotein
MWSFRTFSILAVFGAVSVAGCTVEPLNAARSDSQVASGTVSNSTRSILQQTEVDAVTTRDAQQVRNQLLFAMNGGTLEPGGRYRVKLSVDSKVVRVAIEQSSLSPTASQVIMKTNYALVDKVQNKTVAQGERQVVTPFNNTPQSFATQRAQREAVNRAAAQMAQQLRLAIAQNLSSL